MRPKLRPGRLLTLTLTLGGALALAACDPGPMEIEELDEPPVALPAEDVAIDAAADAPPDPPAGEDAEAAAPLPAAPEDAESVQPGSETLFY